LPDTAISKYSYPADPTTLEPAACFGKATRPQRDTGHIDAEGGLTTFGQGIVMVTTAHCAESLF
jgi:hypothetical protein